MTASAKRDLRDIWQVATKAEAARAYESLKATYDAKYPDAVACLVKDRESQFTFYDFSAEHWRSIRTTNAIESTFGTIRHRTRQAKGCESRQIALLLMFKFGCVTENHWRGLRGFEHLAKVVVGVQFAAGIEIEPIGEHQPPSKQKAV